MKIAKLHTGKMLQFPDETPDDAIDHTVQEHLKNHYEKQEKEKKEKELSDNEQKHKAIMNALGVIAQIHHGHSQKMDEFLRQAIIGHGEVMNALKDITKAHLRPKKRKGYRDKDGNFIMEEM